MDNPGNKEKIAIVVVGYNRLKSIQRLLDSLLAAQYPSNDVPLVISIDCSGCTELYDYVRQFEWPHGEKYVIIQEERLGLKEHIFRCGDLTRYFKAIILLEDDLFVSPHFYDYVQQTVDVYGHDERIAEISLYKNERNGYVGLPFSNLQKGADVFLMQDVGTWGECWTERMWNDFKKWYEDICTEDIVQEVDMPAVIKGWTKAWSKYFNAYVVCHGKYILYPNVSVSTNFSDAGEHVDNASNVVQVSLLMNQVEYRLPPVDNLVKYDIYFNNVELYDWLGIRQNEVTLDIYGFHAPNEIKKFLLSTKKLPYKIIKSYGLQLRPIELNIKYNIQGKGIYLYNTNCRTKGTSGFYNKEVASYFLRGFNGKLLIHQAKRYKREEIKVFYNRVVNKLKKCLS